VHAITVDCPHFVIASQPPRTLRQDRPEPARTAAKHFTQNGCVSRTRARLSASGGRPGLALAEADRESASCARIAGQG